MEKEEIKILQEINTTLKRIDNRQDTEEVFAEPNKLLERADKRVDDALNQIQNSLDRIHDKTFNFNTMLIGAYLALSTFPNNAPKIQLWTIIFPILVLVLLIWLDIFQMEIYRFASREKEWVRKDLEEHGKKIKKHTRYSLLALFLSVCCLIYLVIKLL